MCSHMTAALQKKSSGLSLVSSMESEGSQLRVPIEALLSEIFASVFKLPDADIAPYVSKMRENLITDSYILSRLKENALDKLQLPIGLESELKRYIVAESIQVTTNVNGGSAKDPPRERSESPNPPKKTKRTSQIPQGNSSILGLTPDSVRLIKESWKLITARENLEDGSSRLAKFFSDFYNNFLEKDPLARKLFEGASMQVQAQSLMKMLKFIIAGMDNPVQLVRPLQKLGVRHLIYGVEMKNFQMFGIALAQSFEAVLGKAVCSTAMKEAWYLLTQALAEIMTKEYNSIKAGYYSPIYHRNSRGRWGLVEAYLNHERLVIYTDSTRKKVKSEWMLSHVDSLEILDDASRISAPNTWCFSIALESTVTFLFCATSEEDLLDWTNDLTERIEAYQRVGRFVSGADANPGSSGEEELSDSGGQSAALANSLDAKARAKKKASRLRDGLKMKSSVPAK